MKIAPKNLYQTNDILHRVLNEEVIKKTYNVKNF